MEMLPRWESRPRYGAARPGVEPRDDNDDRWVIRPGEAGSVGGDDQREAPPAPAIGFAPLITAVSARLANVDTGAVGGHIGDSLRELVVALDVDRGSVIRVGAAGASCRVLYHGARSGLPALPTGAAVLTLPTLARAARDGMSVQYGRLDEVADPAERECLRRAEASSGVAVPLQVGDGALGMLCFTSQRGGRHWTLDDVARMHLVASVIASGLAIRHCQSAQARAQAQAQRLRDRFEDRAVRIPAEPSGPRLHRLLASDSPSMRGILEQVAHVAPTTATVLLCGETGTGKEVLAQAIHDLSPRHRRPMVRVNCGAIPAALIESELFGRERGAYTGALSSQAGRFEMAEGSTIFLDEIGELPLDAQVKLLRVLQEREVERLGGTRPIKIDVRVIAATNKDLERAVAEQTFREDLFYRLNVFPMTVPPLRERVGDLPTLVWTFIDECAKALGKPVTSIARDSLVALQQYRWPGNVRELRNLIERAVITTSGPHLVVDVPRPAEPPQQRSRRLEDVEIEHIRAVLEGTGWRVRGAHGAAALLGLKPTTLESRLVRLGLTRSNRSQAAGRKP